MAKKKETNSQSDEPLLNNNDLYYDPTNPTTKDRSLDAAKTELDVAIGDAERRAETALENSGIDKNSPEASLYKQSSIQQSKFSNAVQSVRMANNWKKGGGVAGIIAIITGILFFFSFLTTFQLVGLVEQLDNVFDAQNKRVLNNRAAKHYRYALNEDGIGYYRKDLPDNPGKLRSAFTYLNPNDLYKDLSSKGYVIGVDANGVTSLNGKPLEGKLSDQRNQLSKVLKEQYPNDSWMKRHARARATYNLAGIKRVFFFENTKAKINNWELEMISRLRSRMAGASVDTGARLLGDPTAEQQAAADELKTKLENPSYDPATDPDRIAAQADATAKGAGLVSGGGFIDSAANTAFKGVSLTGWVDLACDIKYYFKGIEFAAVAVRNIGLLRHANSFMTAAHQMKEGQYVTAAQVNALMVILNREPGIGASGAWQMINGKSDAKVKYSDQLGLSFTGATGGAGLLTGFNDIADGVFDKAETVIPDKFISPEQYCSLSRNWWYQGASLGAGILAGIGAAITSAPTAGTTGAGFILKTLGQLTLAATYEALKYVAQPLLTDMLVGPELMFTYSPSQGGDYNMDGLVAGRHQFASATSYQNGLNRELSTAQVIETETKIAQEKANELKEQPLTTRYLSLNNTDSLLFKTLMNTPNSPKGVAQTSISAIGNLPMHFANSISLLTPQGKAKAEIPTASPYFANNPFGIKPYGYSEADLEKLDSIDPIGNEEEIMTTGKLEAYKEWRNKCFPKDYNTMMYYGLAMNEDEEALLRDECTNLDDEQIRKYSAYHLDRVINAGILFQSGISDCIDPDADEWDCEYTNTDTFFTGSSNVFFRAGTLNVLGNQHTEADGKLRGWDSGTIRIVKEFDALKSNGLQVVGLQELEIEQRTKLVDIFKDEGNVWSIYPETADYSYFRSSNSIIWNSTVFDLVDKGFQDNLEYLDGRDMEIPWVKLRHKTSGQIVYFQNTHDPAYKENRDYRYENAQEHLKDASSRIASGEKVIVVGDFNANMVVREDYDGADWPRTKLSYCVLTKDSLLQNAYDVNTNTTGYCPTKERVSIDHIYVSRDLGVQNWTRSIQLQYDQLTDHDLIYADIMLSTASTTPVGGPGSGGGSTSCSDPNSTSIYWPLKAPRNIRNSHDLGTPIGTPVYAVKSGTVKVSKDLVGCDGRICGDGMYSYGRHIVIDHGISNGVVTYAHLNERSVVAGQKVAAGQLIGYSGNSGNSTGPHLHVDFNYYSDLGVIRWLNDNRALEPPCASAVVLFEKLRNSTLPDSQRATIASPIITENQYV